MSKAQGSTEPAKTPSKGEPQAAKASAPAPTSTGRTKGHTPLPDGCHSVGCKSQATSFNFCTEHYDHFKFGLIKKTGEQVPDYEKKIGHYQAYKDKQVAARKVA